MENKTAQQIAGTIPCACSDCGMNEVAGTKMIQEYAKQELSAYKERLKDAIVNNGDFRPDTIIELIDTL